MKHVIPAIGLALLVATSTDASAAQIGYYVWGAGGGRVSSASFILQSTLAEPVASAVDVSLGESFALTHGYWFYTFCCPSVGVEPPTAADVPAEFRFAPSAPSPF